jgi:hypothetical protein
VVLVVVAAVVVVAVAAVVVMLVTGVVVVVVELIAVLPSRVVDVVPEVDRRPCWPRASSKKWRRHHTHVGIGRGACFGRSEP